MTVDEIVKFKRSVCCLRQNIKGPRFGIHIYKLCHRCGYIYDMIVCLEKQRKVTSTDVTPTHGTVLELVAEVEGVSVTVYALSRAYMPRVGSHL
jgi:hypothetical protein